MKNILISSVVILILGFSSTSHAVFKPLGKVKYLSDFFETRVEELIKVEFTKSQDQIAPKQEYLLKQLRELLDKETKKI